MRAYFATQVQPVLTPLAVDQAHPFPLLGNKTLNVLVSLDDPATASPEKLMIILPVPRSLPRIVQIAPEAGGPRRPPVALAAYNLSTTCHHCHTHGTQKTI